MVFQIPAVELPGIHGDLLHVTLEIQQATETKRREIFQAMLEYGPLTNETFLELVKAIINGNRCTRDIVTRVLWGAYTRRVRVRNHCV